MKQRLTSWFGVQLERLRLHLSRPDALIQLALVGLLTGLLAGGVIMLFRLAVELTQAGFIPTGKPEDYEVLPLWLRFFLPILGGLLIGWIFKRHGKGFEVLGVAMVMERMAYHQGYLKLRGFLLQFAGAAIAIISGHSVGREGPHIFLGAASGSLLGQYLTLPNNGIRTLVGCGAAAGIAASFNTPLAGVIFALEVVMLEYTLASFIPVMLAAVSATVVSFAVFGDAPAFLVPTLHLGSLREIPLLLLLGVITGMASALFIYLVQRVAETSKVLVFWQRTTLAGLLIGLMSLLVPEVMGIGYDTVNAALLGEVGIGFLLVVVAFKMLGTAACIGMGVPGGVIGPALFIGAALGSLTGLLVNSGFSTDLVDVGLYALLGMGAMMGASLQAPLAALIAMMELTHSPQIIMPGMLVIVVAGLTASELFRKESLFVTMLKVGGLDYSVNPVLQALRGMSVASAMQKKFARVGRLVSQERVDELLSEEPEWLLVDEENQPVALMLAVDLARHLQDAEQKDGELGEIDLMTIPARRFNVTPINLQATLQEAVEILESGAAEALYVQRMTAPGIHRIYGVLTREHVESAYKY